MESHSTSPIERACAFVGGQAALAKTLGVSPAVVNQWVKKIRPIPAAYCPAIEFAAGGCATRKDLRPDDWHLIWPELADTTIPGTPIDGAKVREAKGGARKVRTDTRKLRQ